MFSILRQPHLFATFLPYSSAVLSLFILAALGVALKPAITVAGAIILDIPDLYNQTANRVHFTARNLKLKYLGSV